MGLFGLLLSVSFNLNTRRYVYQTPAHLLSVIVHGKDQWFFDL